MPEELNRCTGPMTKRFRAANSCTQTFENLLEKNLKPKGHPNACKFGPTFFSVSVHDAKVSFNRGSVLTNTGLRQPGATARETIWMCPQIPNPNVPNIFSLLSIFFYKQSFGTHLATCSGSMGFRNLSAQFIAADSRATGAQHLRQLCLS